MHRPTRLRLDDINQHLQCVLCDGYLVDATTVVECLHSFCRTCIVRYLENSRFCPVCDVQVHKTKPLLSLRSDKTLQDVVYKLIPGLYQNEMQRRREFYADHPEAASAVSGEERGEGAGQRCFFSPEENISLTLEYFDGTSGECSGNTNGDLPDKDVMTRHLNCPAAVSVAHLKKFIRNKFGVPSSFLIKIMYADHLLSDHYSLVDIAYIYSWRRAGPMKFYYTFIPNNSTPRILLEITEETKPVPPTARLLPSVEVPMDVQEASNPASEASSSDSSTKPKVEDEKMDIESSESSNSVSLPPPSDESTRATDTPETVSIDSSDSNSRAPAQNPVPASSNKAGILPPTVALQIVPAQPPAGSLKLKLIAKRPVEPPPREPKMTKKRGGRRPRDKAAPIQRLARLAPYPPPVIPARNNPPACLAPTMLPMGKMVPSGMTTLSPSLVTALVSSTVNTACKTSMVLSPASFLTTNGDVPVSTGPASPFPTTYVNRLPSAHVIAIPSAVSIVPSSAPVLNSQSPPVLSCQTPPVNNPQSPTMIPTAIASNPVTDVSEIQSRTPSEPQPEIPAAPVDPAPVTETKTAEPSAVPSEDFSYEIHGVEPIPIPVLKVPNSAPTAPQSLSLQSNEIRPEVPRTQSRSSPETKTSEASSDVDTTSESFRLSVKNSISAEFSDNDDDLGDDQPDLVVDEQKLEEESSLDGEDERLRKKIAAIAAGKEDDDADSGRASGVSSQDRSSCDDEPVTSSNIVASAPVPSTTTSAAAPKSISKSNNINHVINNLLLRKDLTSGALDLSTCLKKPGEAPARAKAVANPVLDIKHRQQTYLPAPGNAPAKQHTACPPTPKHPSSSPILMHGLTQPQLHRKSPHVPVPSFPNNPFYPSQNKAVVSSTVTRHALSPPAHHHQTMANMLSTMMPMGMRAPYSLLRTPTPGSLSPRMAATLATVTSPPFNKLGNSYSKAANRKLIDTSGKSLPPPMGRSPNSSSQAASYPKSPSSSRLSPHHKSASPAPSPKSPTTSSASGYKPSIPIYKRPSSSSEPSPSSFKSYNYKFKGSNLAVINPDPNGYGQKLVIRNMGPKTPTRLS